MIKDLQTYLEEEIENIMKDSLKATFDNPRETAFLMSFAASARQAAKKRDRFEKDGEHIPPFLIASCTARSLLPTPVGPAIMISLFFITID